MHSARRRSGVAPPPPEKLERRAFGAQRCEIRAATKTSPAKFSGYAAVYGDLSGDLGGFVERVAPGCFDASIAGGSDVRLLINHDANLILGRTGAAGTLKLSSDSVGLRVSADLPDTTYARDLAVSMGRGDISQMSFGFATRADAWNETDPLTRLPIRELLEAELFDVSPVVFPAYATTSAEVRSRLARFARRTDTALRKRLRLLELESEFAAEAMSLTPSKSKARTRLRLRQAELESDAAGLWLCLARVR